MTAFKEPNTGEPSRESSPENAGAIELFANTGVLFSPSLQLWLSDAENHAFGHGRMRLFQLIEELGSLSKAARSLGMSYRAAWGKIKEMEQATGTALVCSQGSKREGYSLTPEGRALLLAFARWFDDVQSYATGQAKIHFPVITVNSEHTV